jgi:hypothetical protein
LALRICWLVLGLYRFSRLSWPSFRCYIALVLIFCYGHILINADYLVWSELHSSYCVLVLGLIRTRIFQPLRSFRHLAADLMAAQLTSPIQPSPRPSPFPHTAHIHTYTHTHPPARPCCETHSRENVNGWHTQPTTPRLRRFASRSCSDTNENVSRTRPMHQVRTHGAMTIRAATEDRIPTSLTLASAHSHFPYPC